MGDGLALKVGCTAAAYSQQASGTRCLVPLCPFTVKPFPQGFGNGFGLALAREVAKLLGKADGFLRANLYRVNLPPTGGVGSHELNLLCEYVTLPGRQLMSTPRTIGAHNTKIANGFAVEDVTMTFHVLNDLFDGNVEEVILPFVAEFRSRVHAAFANF